jgi:excisionase family DNA binding protein
MSALGSNSLSLQQFAQQDPLLDVSEAASYAGLHPKTLQRLARERRIRAYAVLGDQRKRWRFRKSDIDAWANSCVNSPSDSRQKGSR